MKNLFPFLLFCLLCNCYSTAQKPIKKTIIVKAGSSIVETLTAEDIYRYPNFTYGIAHLRDGKLLGAKLNYNLLLQDMQFLTPKGDTLSVISETLDYITINRDTFYFDKRYMELYLGHPMIKLAIVQWVNHTDKQKIGAYGMPNTSSSIDNFDHIDIGTAMQKLTVQEDEILTWETIFLAGDEHNHFGVFNKKSLLDMFPKYRTAIKDYLKENNVNFNKEEDIVKMTKFLQQIPS